MVCGSLASLPVLINSVALYLAKFQEQTAPKPISVLNDRERFQKLDRYPVTKLIEIFILRKITRLSNSTGIIVSAVNPGLCRSDIGRNASIFFRAIGG
jgi:hypothetical protein